MIGGWGQVCNVGCIKINVGCGLPETQDDTEQIWGSQLCLCRASLSCHFISTVYIGCIF